MKGEQYIWYVLTVLSYSTKDTNSIYTFALFPYSIRNQSESVTRREEK
jgi:hypothetical protein